MGSLSEILQASTARHTHLCPRQVLGARLGLYGLALLDINPPVTRGTALIILEADGCFADAIEIATGATIGHRTLRINDYGKIAATFVEVKTGRALRLSPVLDVRAAALHYAPQESRHYFAQLKAYQVMPAEEMFLVKPVILRPGLDDLLGQPGVRVNCARCGEDIINNRQVLINGELLCQACAGAGYYRETQLVLGAPYHLSRYTLIPHDYHPAR